jgi:hypothetical protein
LGALTIDDKFVAYTIEDAPNAEKVYGQTCIPEGEDILKFTDSLKFTDKYGHLMVEITGIPKFSNVYIHPGLTNEHTLGCPLVGDEWTIVNGNYQIVSGHSFQHYMNKVYPLLFDYMKRCERNGTLPKIRVTSIRMMKSEGLNRIQ